jgi:hypothetical protein
VSKNKTIGKLLTADSITQVEYDILFENKESWYTTKQNGEQDWSNAQDKVKLFYEAFEHVIHLSDINDVTDLSHIYFPPFDFQKYIIVTSHGVNFQGSTFNGSADFTKAVFTGGADFWQAKFNDEVKFSKAVFGHKARFVRTTFSMKANFLMTNFLGTTDFREAIFKANSIFNDAIFSGKTNFNKVFFRNNANFYNASFKNTANFRNVKFSSFADFSNSIFDQKFILRDSKIGTLKLNDIEVENLNLLNISAFTILNIEHGKTLTKANFGSKETARIIKAHLEMQNNITESNKYFALEQELYLDELVKSSSTEPNKYQTMIALYFNKHVSNFGTDWLRSLLALIIMGYLFMIGYMGLDSLGWLLDDKDKMITHFTVGYYIPYSFSMIGFFGSFYLYTLTYRDKDWLWIGGMYLIWTVIIVSTYSLHPWDFSCYVVQITNPIGVFKDVELYKGIEFYASIVRITIAIMIYQLIAAFRNNTRRSLN